MQSIARLAATAYIVARPANTSGQAQALPFESVQAGLFSVPNSYSNAIPLHFGLAKLEPVTVEVTFMSKQGPKKQTIRNVNAANFYGKPLVIREAP